MENFKVLIVEDDNISIQYLSILFTKWGIHYELAKNGLEAISKSMLKKYQIIFMDINMPLKNGIEATKSIRKPKNPNCTTPIFALTSDDSEERLNKALECGMTGYLLKPYNPSEIESTLKTVLNTLQK